ncbi:MAG: thioredoxin family protein [Planctomycetota bacterium]|jgi:hypothetical protein|nr:thioredoxin family protein [Planctomycetota bacterium]
MLKKILLIGGLAIFAGCASTPPAANAPAKNAATPAPATPAAGTTVRYADRAGGVLRKHEFGSEERMGATLVYFAKTVCPACAQQDPIYQNLIRSLPSGVRARKVFEYEVDNSWYGVEQNPTMVIYVDGKEVWRHVGVIAEADLRAAIAPHTAVVNNWAD